MATQLPITVVFHKEKGELVIKAPMDRVRYQTFMNNLKEGEKVEVTYEVQEDDHSWGQVKKVHACIRIISTETGASFEETKQEVKRKSGLLGQDGKFKSFADCSKEELSHAIQAAIAIGEYLGINMNTY